MMHSATVTAMSYTQQAPSAPAAPPPPRPADQLRDEVRDAIRAGQDAARDAAQDVARAEQDAARALQEAGQAREGRPGRIVIEPGIAPPFPRDGFSFEQGGGGGFNGPGGIPPQVAEISIAFFVMCAVMVIGWPIARAFGKRLERRGDPAVPAPAMAEQLQRIERAVEAMSIEVERISESQRFIARLQSERIPQSAARE